MELENLKIKILEDINSSKLRIDCVYYVLKDIYRDIELTYEKYLLTQKAQEEDIKKGDNE